MFNFNNNCFFGIARPRQSFLSGSMFYINSLLIDVLLVASFSSDYDSKLPIVLFVGQHFSGSLFE